MSLKPHTAVHVSREFDNLVAVGGAKDTTYGICTASSQAGIDTHLFLPFPYSQEELSKAILTGSPLELSIPMNLSRKERRTETAAIHSYVLRSHEKLTLHLVQSERFAYLCDQGQRIPRDHPYTYSASVAKLLGEPNLEGEAYSDLFEMNVLLVKAALKAITALDLYPDVIHCHDAQLGFLPLIAQCTTEDFAARIAYIPTVITVHNLTNHYRGEVQYDELIPSVLGVPHHISDKLLNGEKFEPLLCAGLFGSAVSTVSENYAHEMQFTGTDWKFEWLGHRLLSLGIQVEGITNGIDLQEFDPSDAARMHIPAAYDPRTADFRGKEICKEMLLKEIGFAHCDERTIVLGSVGRLDYHKGSDILAKALGMLFEQDHDVILVGTGGGYKTQIEVIAGLQSRFLDRVYFNFNYDYGLGNRIYAGSDFFVMPSRHEACGIADFVAQLFGSLPIVHAVGGLVKVIDGETGFSYRGDSPELLAKLRAAIDIYRSDRPRIRRMQQQAVDMILSRFTWQHVFQEKYLPLYQRAIEKTRQRLP